MEICGESACYGFTRNTG